MRPPIPGRHHDLSSDRGSAVVDFVFVAPLLLLAAVAIVQLSLTLYLRATLTSAAAEGARAAALAGSSPTAGEQRARDLLDGSLAAGVIDDISIHHESLSGRGVLSLDITARLPLIGLLGPSAMTVSGHALEEHA